VRQKYLPHFKGELQTNGTRYHQKRFISQMSISQSFFTLGFQNCIVQMVAVTADTHLEPFFLNGLLELVQGPRTMFENLGLEVPQQKKVTGT
jgi:hypothetical protein